MTNGLLQIVLYVSWGGEKNKISGPRAPHRLNPALHRGSVRQWTCRDYCYCLGPAHIIRSSVSPARVWVCWRRRRHSSRWSSERWCSPSPRTRHTSAAHSGALHSSFSTNPQLEIQDPGRFRQSRILGLAAKQFLDFRITKINYNFTFHRLNNTNNNSSHLMTNISCTLRVLFVAVHRNLYFDIHNYSTQVTDVIPYGKWCSTALRYWNQISFYKMQKL